MKITIEPTAQIVDLNNGVQARVWTGVSDRGTRCDLFIARIAVSMDEPVEAQRVFERELLERRAPSVNPAWPARMLLDFEDDPDSDRSRR